ncbi:butyrophilin subfamily 1 member A1-like isoform X2 [Ursus americanus]|uniref:butyrophilin subfamily 1 member A1-like isoform X2 n=1 Tax=Ursus americanus TaxID=9643 RepID=UPI001E67D36B|nr:butyrophilin subfamily 1 member A1-like isoform X2 [Ursus americanus]
MDNWAQSVWKASSEEMEDCCRGSLLSLLPSLFLLLQLPAGGSAEEFMVIGPSDPIVAVLRGDVTLPCSVSPAMNVENMELRWFRSKFSEAVFIYQNQQEQREEQLAQYTGRTSLVKEFLTWGEAAVRIHNVQAFDNGMYTCFFRKGSFCESASLELKVAGVGSVPQVHIQGLEEDGVRVVCMASGWFPKPEVRWKALSGEKFLTFSETHAQDPEGLFSVEATLVVRDSSSGNVTCSLLNPILSQEKAMAIIIPEDFFPRTSPWMSAFMVILTLLMLLLLGTAYYTKREHTAKCREVQEWMKLHREKEEDQQAKVEALKTRDELQEDLAWRKSVYLADWRKEKFQPLSVTLDPKSAHPSLAVSDEKTSVTLKDTAEDPTILFSILGRESITSGRCYWVVEIRNGDKSEWSLGVCRGDVDRKSLHLESPEKGIWAVGRYLENYYACSIFRILLSCRQVPHRVGVFLDLKEGDVSFYNMTDDSHMFSFPLASSSGTLFPYFMLRSGDVSLTICSVMGGPAEILVPLNNPPSSSEEPVSLSGVGLKSVSDVDGALPGAESPLLPCSPEAMSP